MAGLNELLEARYKGSVVNAALDCGFSRSTVCAWARGESRPPLGMLMVLCYRAEADIAALLEGHYLHVPAPAGTLVKPTRKYERSRSDWETVGRALTLASQQSKPPTTKEIAEKLGVPRRSIQTFAPRQAAELALARRGYAERCRAERIDGYEVTLVRAAEAILSQGRKVSCKRLINQSGIAAFKHS